MRYIIGVVENTMSLSLNEKLKAMSGKIIIHQKCKCCSCLEIQCTDIYLRIIRNRVVVHGNAGKGRTGTSIAGFLIYSGLGNTAEEAIKYYGYKRFSHGKGVTQPSQIRYVKYFELIYKNKVCSPISRVLKSVYFIGVPKLSGNQAKIYFEIYNATDLSEKIYSSKSKKMVSFEFYNEDYDSKTKNILFEEDETQPLLLSGDILIRFKNGNSMTNQTLGRVSFNAAFLDNVFELTADKIDPDSFCKDKRFSEYFTIGIQTVKSCRQNKCEKTSPVLCQRGMEIEDIEKQIGPWSKIRGLLCTLKENNGGKLPDLL